MGRLPDSRLVVHAHRAGQGLMVVETPEESGARREGEVLDSRRDLLRLKREMLPFVVAENVEAEFLGVRVPRRYWAHDLNSL